MTADDTILERPGPERPAPVRGARIFKTRRSGSVDLIEEAARLGSKALVVVASEERARVLRLLAGKWHLTIRTVAWHEFKDVPEGVEVVLWDRVDELLQFIAPTSRQLKHLGSWR